MAPKHWVFKLYMLLISSVYLNDLVDRRPFGSSYSSSQYLIQFVHQKLWMQNFYKSNRFSFENLRNVDKLWITLFFLLLLYLYGGGGVICVFYFFLLMFGFFLFFFCSFFLVPAYLYQEPLSTHSFLFSAAVFVLVSSLPLCGNQILHHWGRLVKFLEHFSRLGNWRTKCPLAVVLDVWL